MTLMTAWTGLNLKKKKRSFLLKMVTKPEESVKVTLSWTMQCLSKTHTASDFI